MSECEPGSCVIGTKPHQADGGTYVCRHHLERLAAMLRDVEDEAIQLEIRPSMAVVYDKAGGGLASQQSPVRLDALVLRDRRHGTGTTRADFDETGWDGTPSVLETLHAWARLVREERGLTTPERITVTGERDTLSRQLDWACAQPWVDEFYAEMADLLAALRRANGTIQRSVGVCESLQPDGSLCDGDVWDVLIRPDGSIERGSGHAGRDDEPGFRCGKCRRVWTGTEAVRLRDRMWRDEQERKATA